MRLACLSRAFLSLDHTSIGLAPLASQLSVGHTRSQSTHVPSRRLRMALTLASAAARSSCAMMMARCCLPFVGDADTGAYAAEGRGSQENMLEALATARPSALVLACRPLTKNNGITSTRSRRHLSATLPLPVWRIPWAQMIPDQLLIRGSTVDPRIIC